MRVEKDVVTSNENCYQKDAELCGPRNCKVIEKIAKTIRIHFAPFNTDTHFMHNGYHKVKFEGPMLL